MYEEAAARPEGAEDKGAWPASDRREAVVRA
jgi:hypothetical protein